MTRKEKIAELINIRDNFNYTLAPKEIFNDAIKALEQEPCEDVISRQAVLALPRKTVRDPKTMEVVYETIDVTDIEALPSATPKQKMGHWIDKFAGVYRCSCCREIIEIDIEIEHPNGITFNYCPNCGARMVKP